MSDNSRLSGEQALDDYFFDLLAEPSDPVISETVASEPELQPIPDAEPQAEGEVIDDAVNESEGEASRERQVSDDLDNTVVDVTELNESTIVISDHIEASTSYDESPENEESDDVDDAPTPSAEPFDFGVFDVQSNTDYRQEEPDYPAIAPLRQPWVMPQRASWFDDAPVETAQNDLQRLLNQVSLIQAEPEIEPEPELVTLPSLSVSDELEDEWQQVMAYDAEQSQCVTIEVALDADSNIETTAGVDAELNKKLSKEVNAEVDAEDSVELETQASASLPPDDWQQEVEQDDAFQALFFEVNGVTFAVPLTELGGIHELGEVSHLLGRPPWYLGLMTTREHQLDVVDTASWVMPDKLTCDDHRETYRYVVMLGESKWGLACNVLQGTELLTGQSVRWREKAGKRPWLAGMVKEKMCALIHVSELITMLNAGLDVNTKIMQS